MNLSAQLNVQVASGRVVAQPRDGEVSRDVRIRISDRGPGQDRRVTTVPSCTRPTDGTTNFTSASTNVDALKCRRCRSRTTRRRSGCRVDAIIGQATEAQVPRYMPPA